MIVGHITTSRVWPIAIMAWALAAMAAALLAFPSPLRQALVLSFLAAGPGLAYVRLFSLESQLTTWTLAFALSVAINAAVAVVMLYGEIWAPTAGLVVVALVTTVGAVLEMTSQRTVAGPASAVTGKRAERFE